MAILKIVNKQLRKLLEEKEELVTKGRKVSEEIEGVQNQITNNDTARKAIMEKIQPKELIEKGDAIEKKINAEIELAEKKVGKDTFRKMVDKNALLFIVSCIRAEDKEYAILNHVNELGKIVDEVQKLKFEAIPKSLNEEAKTLVAKKDELETKRNKIFLKVQKIKDRATPIIQREATPHLSEYEDIETAQIKGEQIIIVTYDRLEDWKASFAKNKKDKKVV